MTKIGFIGAGQMATALGSGIARSTPGTYSFFISDPDTKARDRFIDAVGDCANVEQVADNQHVVSTADVVFLAVKPQYLDAALNGLDFSGRPLIVSIIAGATLRQLERLTDCDRMIRVMPNTPCLIGQGAIAIAALNGITKPDRYLIQQFMQAVGHVIEVDESLIDAVTGLSGSGPAYVFTFIEALIDGGVLAGLPRQHARMLAIQTVIGAASMLAQSTLHPAELRDQVTSPGGTTIAGYKMLEEAGFRDAVMSAVVAAAERAAEL